jgi:uncharacterized protein YoxC
MMNQLKKDLKAVAKDLKGLTQKTEKMVKRVEKLEKAQAAKKPKAKAVKKAVAKKPAKLSATESVLTLVKRSRKGVDKATLIKKTGFRPSHIHTILYRLRKQGSIKSAGKGLYVKA